jgi:hypothetical protein
MGASMPACEPGRIGGAKKSRRTKGPPAYSRRFLPDFQLSEGCRLEAGGPGRFAELRG